MYKVKRLIFMLTALVTLTAGAQQAQCGIDNKAFGDGERLDYVLKFNWQFIWFRVGTARMTTRIDSFQGQKAWRADLLTSGNPRLDKYFVMRDTLLSYCSYADLTPLYFRKGAHEGKRYYADELWFSYPRGHCHLRRHEVTSHGEHLWSDKEYKDCIYDMMSIFLRARNFDSSSMSEGDILPMPISDASDLSNSWLKYMGKKTFKMDSGEKFRCVVFSFMQNEKGKNRELIRFWITDDLNHIPVRLDMNLNFGSAKAFLTSYKGVRNEMTSKVQ